MLKNSGIQRTLESMISSSPSWVPRAQEKLIDTLTGQSGQRSGSGLESYTTELHAVRLRRHAQKGDRIVFIDTPGFDNTHRSDLEILQTISKWLTDTYKNGVKLAGIVYTHRISDNRMAGTPYRNLRMFGELYGDKAARNVILVTTMWDRVQRHLGEKRESELKSKYWKVLLDRGSDCYRFDNTQASAWAVIDKILESDDTETLLLQEELVELRKRLQETQAGITLYDTLQKALLEQKETIRQLAEQATLQNNPKLAKELEDEYKRIQITFDKTFQELNQLKIPLSRRIVLLLFGKKSKAHSLKIVGE
ncbi:hypothetical protein BDQ12DRAFT_690350 [Crucibulum laeve]|uniref:G domain-containing protein n=1 Tax=Crucibulum laeve TaxID=68775 RepID=A0A5C3LNT8_9AGAR|nr:hypothetical protein BDQ12DRAFT_690350 [Crucibulum laeve]